MRKMKEENKKEIERKKQTNSKKTSSKNNTKASSSKSTTVKNKNSKKNPSKKQATVKEENKATKKVVKSTESQKKDALQKKKVENIETKPKEKESTDETKKDYQLEMLFTKEKERSKFRKILFPLFVLLAVLLIGFSIYKFYFMNPKRIMSHAITSLSEKFDGVFDQQTFGNKIGSDYTLDGTINFDIHSDLLDTFSQFSEYKPYAKLVKNLNDSNIKLQVMNESKSKKTFLKMNGKLHDKELFDVRLINQNEKNYVRYRNALDNYIELEDSNAIIKEFKVGNSGLYDNLDYIYHYVIGALKRNLKEDYFTTENTKIKLQGKMTKVKKNTLVLDNKNGNEFFKNVVSDLKSDKKLEEILEKYGIKLKDLKWNNKNWGKDKILFTVYTNTITCKELKYELDIQSEEDNIKLVYLDEKNDTINLYYQDRLIASALVKTNGDETTVDFTDDKDKKVGNVKIIQKDDYVTFDFNIDYQNITLQFKVETELLKEDDDFKNKELIQVKVKQKDFTYIDIKAEVNGTVTKKSNIKDTIDKAIKISDLTQKQKKSISDEINHLEEQLMK